MERFGLPGMQVCKKAMTITRRYSFDVSRVTPVVCEVRPVCLATRGWRLGRGLRIASPPELTGDARTHFTADPFRYKRGDREDPGVCGIFLCHLKKEGYCLGMSPFLLGSRKDDSLCLELASPSGFEPLLTA